ncbi:hypothetical protein KYC_27588 [Achromobacter arsenitoxydans SY8]|uniref:DUF4123 domain-containing protein n=2 Tax=Achromobacter TaxID=222 RepID=H0FFE8_9BURK|nr:hypothetical protein KYC_27588 [Achromobacter arsenitoxydans SY8]
MPRLLLARRAARRASGARMNKLSTFMLLDGALLHGTSIHDRALERPEIRLLYEDQGPLAARVGPLLLPEHQEISLWLNQLASTRQDVAFAYSLLRTPSGIGQVLEHLQRLRFIHARSGKRYYFRFADGRAFANVWEALSIAQRDAVLGPVQAWHHHDAAGKERCVRTSGIPQASIDDALPLQLEPKQWHQVLRTARISDLFHAASNLDYGPQAQGSHAQRYAWTVQIHDRLQRLQIVEPAVQVAATRVVWRTAGRLLGDQVFEAALKKADSGVDIRSVFAFGQTTSFPRIRLT